MIVSAYQTMTKATPYDVPEVAAYDELVANLKL
jgi:hypothetical protein